jgi:hypothetical protein
MTTEDWKLQVSYKTPGGDMINVRANTADELSVLLEGIGDYSPQIAAVQKLVVASYNTAPLETPPSMPSTPPSTSLETTPAPAASPTCIHGNRKYLAGVSKKNGKPYAMWVCPQPFGSVQCEPVN